MRKNFFSKLISLSTLFLCLMTVVAFANSSFTYNGYGIRGKRSIGRLTATTGISVSHTNSNWNMPVDQEMEIRAERDVWWGWSKEASYSTYGNGTTNFNFTELPSGTYSLYFHAPNNPAAADISGSATGF